MYQWVTHTGFYWANLKENNPSVDADIEGKDIKMDLKQILREGVDCINLAQHNNKWRAAVNTKTQVWIRNTERNSLTI
jgi:hypothetical protein